MKITLCVITKDEEKNIERCIRSVKEVVDEIIVVDTGSIDNTKEIVQSLGGRVYEFKWESDFSKARNYALSKAIGDWIIFLDADEYLKEECSANIRPTIQMAQKNKQDALFVEFINCTDDMSIMGLTKSIRIFKNKRDIQYVNPIHEHIIHKKRRLKAIEVCDAIKIYHTGYSKVDIEEKNKAERNMQILLEEEKKKPHDATVCFYIGETYLLDSNYEKALEYTYKVEEYNNSNILGSYIKNKSHQLTCAIMLGKSNREILNIYEQAIQQYNSYPDYDYEMARYYLESKDYNEALEYLNSCIKKMNKYNDIAESACMGKVEEIFEVLARIYIEMNQLQNSVTALVNLLKYNKYNVYGSYHLLDILCENESIDNVYTFFMKIYDETKSKDMLFLAKILKELRQGELLKKVEKHLDEVAYSIWILE